MEDIELEKLLKDTEALLKRWKKAASDTVGDNLSVGQVMVSHVYAANVAFHAIYEELAKHDYLPEGTEDLEFF